MGENLVKYGNSWAWDSELWNDMFDSIWKKAGNSFVQDLLNDGIDVNFLNEYGTTMLNCAAYCGNLELAEFLLLKGADANIANPDGCIPLHTAVENGHKDIVKLFIDQGISADSCDAHKATPLHYVARAPIDSFTRENHQELVHILVNGGANIDAVDSGRRTPLLHAAQNRYKHMVDLLIKLGADLECCDEDQWTVLHHVCYKRWMGTVRTILEGKSDIDINARTSEGYPPVIISAKRRDKETVKLLIEYGAQIHLDSCKKTLLNYACKEGWLELVKFLLSKGFDVNTKDSRGRTPLIMATHFSDSSVVDFLIECKADVNLRGEGGLTLLHHACSRGWLDLVKSLVDKGCDFNAKGSGGDTPLLLATASYHHYIVVDYLIECGADIYFRNDKGLTFLNYACGRGWLDMVKSFANKGYDLNARDSRGDTPLLNAALKSHRNVVEYLIECGADVKLGNGDEMLHCACSEGWLDIVKSLVSKGCDLNTIGWSGSTPLLLAASRSHLDVVEYLIESGADVKIRDENGRTWLHYACKEEWLGVVNSLANKGSDFDAKDK